VPATLRDEGANDYRLRAFQNLQHHRVAIGYCCVTPLGQSIGFFSDLVYVCAPAPCNGGWPKAHGIEIRILPANIGSLYQEKREDLRGMLQEAWSLISPGRILRAGRHQPASGKTSKKGSCTCSIKPGRSVPGEAFYHDDAGKNWPASAMPKKTRFWRKPAEGLRV